MGRGKRGRESVEPILSEIWRPYLVSFSFFMGVEYSKVYALMHLAIMTVISS